MDTFIGSEIEQNCGDILRVIDSERKICSGKNRLYYICEFIKYPYRVSVRKEQILSKQVANPQIERDNFIGKEFLQNCGDTLKVLEKIKNKDRYLFKGQFLKYPYIVIQRKDAIIKGQVNNPQIEQVEFVQKLWPQKRGGTIKIIEKTNKKQNEDLLWKVLFVEDNIYTLAIKNEIIKGQVNNPKNKEKYIILESKNNLLKFIQDNFPDKKPTYRELAQKANLPRTSVNAKILEYDLKDYIDFPKDGSFIESKLRDYIKLLNNNTLETSTWNELDGKEIDIYIPNLKLGFEYNGNFWHSSDFKSFNYHQEKSLLAKEKGIQLIHIWEWEIRENFDLIQNFIKSKLGIFDKKIGASKCKIKELNNQEYSSFCEENHLQGSRGAKVKLGLFYKDELVQVMSFGVPRFTDKYEWEIIRECSKANYCIIGGKQKLWNFFIKNYHPNNCISYCDFSKFNGNSYLKLGFKFERLNKPGFVWYNHSKEEIYWRNPYKHQEMKEKGYSKIYDCGQLVFVWNKI